MVETGEKWENAKMGKLGRLGKLGKLGKMAKLGKLGKLVSRLTISSRMIGFRRSLFLYARLDPRIDRLALSL
jgi:hypothetical protein